MLATENFDEFGWVVPNIYRPTTKEDLWRTIRDEVDNMLDGFDVEDTNHYLICTKSGKIIDTREVTRRIPKSQIENAQWISANEGLSTYRYWYRDAATRDNMIDYMGFDEWEDGVEVKRSKWSPYNDKETISLPEVKEIYRFQQSKIDENDWVAFAGRFDHVSLYSEIKSIAEDYGIELIAPLISDIDSGQFKIEYSDADGLFTLTRHIFREEGTGLIIANHSHFELPKRLQHKGISKRLLSACYRAYEKMGVSEMRVRANLDVGGYTWAKYGFYAKNRAEALKVAEFDNVSDSIIEGYYRKNGLSNDKPFPMYLLAETESGLGLLLGSSWDGYINMTDRQMVRHFKGYLGL